MLRPNSNPNRKPNPNPNPNPRHLAYCDAARQQLAECGAFGAIGRALQAHPRSKHVVKGATLTLLKLTIDSVLRSQLAIDAGVPAALQEALETEHRPLAA